MKSTRRSNFPQNVTVPAFLSHDPVTLQQEVEELKRAIARRAYELFEARGRDHGHDLDDWFQAESELVSPVRFEISEKKDSLSVRANVSGFNEDDLKTSVEPRRLVIFGKKQAIGTAARQTTSSLNLILSIIDLPVEIDPKRTIIDSKAGVLNFELPKLAEPALPENAQAA